MDARVEPVDRVEVGAHDILRLELARSDLARDLAGGKPARGCFDHSSSVTA
jgi:hypothetical protein